MNNFSAPIWQALSIMVIVGMILPYFYCFIICVLIICPSSRAAKVAKRHTKVAEYCNSINGKVRGIANSIAPVSLFDIE